MEGHPAQASPPAVADGGVEQQQQQQQQQRAQDASAAAQGTASAATAANSAANGTAAATAAATDEAALRRHMLPTQARGHMDPQPQPQPQPWVDPVGGVGVPQLALAAGTSAAPPPELLRYSAAANAADRALLTARARAEAEWMARRSAAVALERRQVELRMAQVRAAAGGPAQWAQAQAQAQQVQMEQRLIEAEARAIRQALAQARAQQQQQQLQAQAPQAAGAQVPAVPQAPMSQAALVGVPPIPISTQPVQAQMPPPPSTTANNNVINNNNNDEDEDIHNLPTFTAEDERRELSNLTPQEILQLRSDMLGLTAHMAGLQASSASSTSAMATSATAIASSPALPLPPLAQQSVSATGSGLNGGGTAGAAAAGASPLSSPPIGSGVVAAAANGINTGTGGTAVSSPTGGATTTTGQGENMDSLLRRHERHIRAEADLHNLQTELAALPPGPNKVAYLLAIAPDRPCHAEATGRSAQGRNRHMAYLEGCNFDARAAAHKIVQYWTERLELFGPDRAFERMSLHGAMKDEIDWMVQSSIAQTLPYRDRSGRTIIFGDPSRRDMSVYETRRQNMAMWYLLETIIEDEESRSRGLVVLTSAKTYSTGSGMDLKFTRFAQKLIADIFPVHLRSIHFCHPSKVAHYVIFPALKFVLGKEMRLRFNTHYGTDAEVLLQLETFGLHRSILPAELCGDIQLDFRQWIQYRLSRERSAEALEVGAPGTAPPTASAAIAASVTTSISGGSDVDGLEALSLAAAVSQPVIEGTEEKTQKSWRDLKFKRKQKRKLSQTEDTSTVGDPGISSSELPSPLNHAGNPVNPNRRVPFKLNRQSKKDLIDLEEVLNDTETPKSGKKKVGRRADPRMNRAVRIKLRNPEITPFAALVQGGYDYPTPVKGSSAHEIFDSDNVSLHQRKNQLCRRVRQLREKQKRDEARAARAAAK